MMPKQPWNEKIVTLNRVESRADISMGHMIMLFDMLEQLLSDEDLKAIDKKIVANIKREI